MDRYIGMKQNEMIVNEVLPLIGNSILKTVTELSYDDYQVKLDDTAVDTLLKLSDRISRLIIEYIRLDTEKYIELFKS